MQTLIEYLKAHPSPFSVTPSDAQLRFECRQHCADLDEDCPTLENPLACYRHDPAKGFCPFIHGKN